MEKESVRQRKIADLLQKEIADIFIKTGGEIYFGKLFTVMRVRVNKDISHAKIYISVFPIDKKKEINQAIQAAKGKIKHQLSIRLKNQLRKLPDIALYLDDSNEYYENIDKLLEGDVENPIK